MSSLSEPFIRRPAMTTLLTITVILFGVPETKDAVGAEAYSDLGIIQRAVQAIKRSVPDLLIITDVTSELERESAMRFW